MKTPISYTAAKMFEQCPHRFHAERIRKIKGPPSVPMAVGNFVHAVADKYVAHLMDSRQASDFTRATEIAQDMWAERRASKDWRIIPEAEKGDVFDLVQALREQVVVEPKHVAATELKLAFTDRWKKTPFFGPKAWFRMVIDRIDVDDDGVAYITDYKTGRSMDSVKGSIQLPLYALGVSLILKKIKGFVVDLHYLRKNKHDPHAIDKSDITKARAWAEAVGNAVDHAVRTNEWNATPGEGCKSCPIRQDCPAKRPGTAAPATTDKEGVTLLEQYILKSNEAEEVKERLKAYVEHNGPVSANGMTAEFKDKPRRKYDIPAILAALRQAGHDITEFVNIDYKSLGRVLGREDGLAERIRRSIQETHAGEFRVAKTK